MPDTPVTALERADVAASRAAAPYRDHPLVKALTPLSKLADQPPLLALSATVAATGWFARSPKLARAGVRMFAAELFATAIKIAVKHVVERARPHALIDDGEYRFGPGDRDEGRYNSFPSGHTAGAVAVTRALAREYPALGPPGMAYSAVVAALQIPRCAHYPSDLAAGWAVGWVAETLTHRAERATRPRN